MPIESGLIGLWELNGNCLDSSGNDNHGHPYGIDFSPEGPNEEMSGSAAFNGVDASIEVPTAIRWTLAAGISASQRG